MTEPKGAGELQNPGPGECGPGNSRGPGASPSKALSQKMPAWDDTKQEAGGRSAGTEPEPEAGEKQQQQQLELSAREYSRRVHEWLWQYYCGCLAWQSCVTAIMMTTAAAAAAPPLPQDARVPPGPRPGSAGARPGPASTPPVPAAGREYFIPSLVQRFIAELVDFFILFFVKAAIILSIMHFSGIKDISKFAMHYIIEEIDEDTSMEDLQKMMVVALIYRLLVCFYEIICIWGAGGATPGKFLLGLRVVTCDTSILMAPNRVLVIPSSNVSITASTIRALIKNFSIAFFFPAFITLLFFQHNRTAYDIVAGTIVIKRNGVR
ncbi:protein FAM8A1 isoform X1 [Rhinatrema bivittatum]|uniref:protein FAM8A1 isoform X1 n=1 Tax=Rhinatrema bivittatum TaxID=194408 RepID=UPI00112CE2AD|nr:protein FAM8A1 isoform X1 [Rhinatrema bivittatum]